MRFKKIIIYISYVILICIGVFFINFTETLSKNNFNSSFEFNTFYSCIPIFLSIIMGILLSIEHLISEFKKSGIWKLNIIKLLFIVIPLLFFTFNVNIYYTNIFPSISSFLVKINCSIHSYLVFGIFSGYNLGTSIYKINTQP